MIMLPPEELEATDRALCEFEDARVRPIITASAWGLTTLCKDATQRTGRQETAGRGAKSRTRPGSAPLEAA